jgi:uncharacterized protein (TIGR02301 family)
LTLKAKQRRSLIMKIAIPLIAGCASLFALGSAVAVAQQAGPDVSAQAAPLSQPEEGQPVAVAAPTTAPAPSREAEPVEDAPVDVPNTAQSDWLPDINLDTQNQANALSSAPKRRAKPRKILSDAGENVLGSGSWGQPSGNEDAQAQLLARASRRERTIDPVKRSQLSTLARVMGALHALRVSCSGGDDQTYRSRMATMLDLEAPNNADIRDPLVDAFNGGFQVYGRGAGACPTDARLQEASLAKQGYELARTLGARYRPAPKIAVALPPANQPRINASVPAAKAVRAPTAQQNPPQRATWDQARTK